MTVENFRRKKMTKAQREGIAAGQPESLSWDEMPWAYDDHAADFVTEGLEMTLLEVGDKMGLSRERVRQLEVNVEKKLRLLRQYGFDIDHAAAETTWAFREIIRRWDAERLNKRMQFAERLLVDDDLVERIQDIFGDSLNNEEIDFSEFIAVAEALDKSKAVELRLVENS